MTNDPQEQYILDALNLAKRHFAVVAFLGIEATDFSVSPSLPATEVFNAVLDQRFAEDPDVILDDEIAKTTKYIELYGIKTSEYIHAELVALVNRRRPTKPLMSAHQESVP